jgi:glycerol-3-phosphate cytidylyltransferase-like family protein
MFTGQKNSAVFHSNRYSADSACEHCGGVVRHENWCITRDPLVFYAYDIVVHPAKLTVEDAMRLHALGVAWGACQGKCTV